MDIAQALGISVMTVSRALAGRRGVSAQTAERVRQTAEKLGYRPHPFVSSLMAYRAAHRRPPQGIVIGWLGQGDRHFGCDNPIFRNYYEGAASAFATRGYRLESFNLLNVEATKLVKILNARGIPGVLLGPSLFSEKERAVAECLPVVQIGLSRHDPTHPRVATDHAENMITCLQHLRAAGFRRIGYFDTLAHDSRNEGRWQAAFLLETRMQGQNVEPLLVRNEAEFTPERLRAYLREYKLDAVVSARPRVADWLRGLSSQSLGFAALELIPGRQDISGIVVDYQAIGVEAAHWLMDHLERPTQMRFKQTETLLVNGIWHEGQTHRKS